MLDSVTTAERPSIDYSQRGLLFSPRFISSLIGLCDGAAVLIAGSAIYLAYVGWAPQSFPAYLLTMMINVGLIVTAFYFAGLYEFDAIKNPVRHCNRILVISVAVLLGLVSLAFALKVSAQFSRVWAFSAWGLGTSLICLARFCAYFLIYRWAQSGRLVRNIAVVGAGEHGRKLVEEIQRLGEPWNHVVGVFDDRVNRIHANSTAYPIIGSVDDLCDFARNNRVDEVIVSLPWSADNRLLQLLDRIRELPVKVRIGPDLIGFRLLQRKYRYSDVCGAPTLDVANKPIEGWPYIFKAIEDRLIASLLIVLFAPLMLCIALLIKVESRGPVLFRQKRYGFNNQVFSVLKFRTMRHDRPAEKDVPQAKRKDPRVTRLGKWLRRSSLDELPQLFNVIQGSMSLVGPRPHAVPHNELYGSLIGGYFARHRTKPGITGWAQVRGLRGETDTADKMRARVEHDIYYIEHWSLMFDLRILAMTPFAVLISRNAY